LQLPDIDAISTDLAAQVKWDVDGLAPGVVQDARDGSVRMLGYLNAESLALTLATGRVHFFSRSRQRLWKKGESSGHELELVDARLDCDGDTLLLRVIPHGPTCHTGADTCFFAPPLATTEARPAHGAGVIAEVAATIAARDAERPEGSYTTYLFEQGVDKIGKKIGEEAAEVIIAAKNGAPAPLANEAADLIYHLLVMLRACDVPTGAVWEALAERRGQTPRARGAR
jgi:phosphoribosyl-AMP cyclohydrolase / phosphoribosyl-ATP pyrophosphohydrolase